MVRHFGRLESKDVRDKDYPIAELLPRKLSRRRYRYWADNVWWGNQGYTSECVGYAWKHWIQNSPITYKTLNLTPKQIYKEAQKIDEWPGENYEGTSVRAGAKILQNLGYITNYYWAWNLYTLVEALLQLGPVVIGVNWYTHMNDTDKDGFIHVEGAFYGGHAILANGVNLDEQKIRLKQSWGRGWGNEGRCWISFDDMNKLISRNGEICIATERKVA